MSTENNNEVTAAEEAATIDSIMGNIERDALINQAREYLQVDISRLEKNTFQPTMFFREKDNPAPRAVFFPTLDGDPQARNKVAWACVLLSAVIDDLHSITWVTDSYAVTQQTKTDGSNWEHGQMQEAFLGNMGPEDAKLVFEQVCYQTMEIMPDGSRRSSMICFRYDRNDDGTVDVHWDDPTVMIEGASGSLQGFYVDMMNDAFGAPKLRSEMEKMLGDTGAALGLSMEAQKLHALCVAVKMVMQQVQMPVLIPARNEEETGLLKRSFEEGPQFGPHKIAVFDQDQIEVISNLEQQFELDSTMYTDALKTQKEA